MKRMEKMGFYKKLENWQVLVGGAGAVHAGQSRVAAYLSPIRRVIVQGRRLTTKALRARSAKKQEGRKDIEREGNPLSEASIGARALVQCIGARGLKRAGTSSPG